MRSYTLLIAVFATVFVCVVSHARLTGKTHIPDTNPPVIKNSVLAQIVDELTFIESAKAYLVFEHKITPGAALSKSKVGAVIKGGYPTPPIGGEYVMNATNQPPQLVISLVDLRRLLKEHGYEAGL